MATTTTSIDAEFLELQSQLTHLRRQRANLSTTLLAHSNTSNILNNHPSRVQKPAHHTALSTISKQKKRTTQALHRAVAGCTAYKVQDPDPYAVDGGRVLGVQIEVFVNGSFLPPYHILLHRPHRPYPSLTIHKHTLPPIIPLAALARTYLPQPAKDADIAPVQDLQKLVRAVRREVQSWHLRLAAVERLREEAGLPPSTSSAQGEEDWGTGGGWEFDGDALAEGVEVLNGSTAPPRAGPRRKGGIVDIKADKAVRLVEIEWAGGLGVSMRVSADGEVERGVAWWQGRGRDAGVERAVVGRIEGVVHPLPPTR